MRSPPVTLRFLIYFVFNVLLLTIGLRCEEFKSYEGYKAYKVVGTTRQIIELKKKLEHYDHNDVIAEMIPDELHVLVSPSFDKTFHSIYKNATYTVTLAIEDFSKVISKELTRRTDEKFDFTEYLDLDATDALLRKFAKDYPQYTEIVAGGKSYEGRQITGLKICANEFNDSLKPSVFIESGIHAREWITPAAITYFINELLTSNNTQILSLRNNFLWHIFPIVNPDGYVYSFKYDRMWRKTRSNRDGSKCYGVDANRNWGYNWGVHGASTDPCDFEIYNGPEPFSEIEIQTLSRYIKDIDNLQVYLAFHADAGSLLVPFSDSKVHDSEYEKLVRIGKRAIEYGKRVNREALKGPGIAVDIMKTQVSGSSMDWAYQVQGVPLAFTFELRGYMFHWPAEKIPEQGREVRQMILGLLREAANMNYFDVIV